MKENNNQSRKNKPTDQAYKDWKLSYKQYKNENTNKNLKKQQCQSSKKYKKTKFVEESAIEIMFFNRIFYMIN
jgi:hypothetical protein